ncbi:MAG: tRNA pseudouridine(55) synthase TruB [Cryomorphaceae bacterium]|nr:tRNA pseudouridine(55) synthase TruB [Cryomorphaceae bacterium]
MEESNPYTEGQILLIDKPYGITSFGVVKKVRYEIRKKYNLKKIKVGHSGTLDPLATGLLILLTGKKTKEIPGFTGLDKVYTGTIKLGATTPCFDREMPEENHQPVPNFFLDELQSFANRYTGNIEQVPPAFSAIKVDGKKLYDSARKGDDSMEIKPREVTIHEFLITGVELPLVHFRIHCSKGTYIRSAAHDFGKMAKCGGYLYNLRREKIGSYDVKDSVELKAWEV